MKISLFASLFLFFIILNTYSQADNSFALYQYNTNIINPAYAGSHETLDIGVMRKWDYMHLFDFESISGFPRIFIANIHSPITKGFGAGFSIENGSVGPITINSLSLSISYKKKLKDNSSLSFGMKKGFYNENVNLVDVLSNSFQTDEININNSFNNWSLAVYYKSKRFYSGLSSSFYFASFSENETDLLISNINGIAGYVFEITEKVKLKPAIIINYNSTIEQTWVFLSGNIYLDDILEIGISTNFSKDFAVTFNSPEILKVFKIGLNIDFLEKGKFQDESYQNISLFTNFYIDAFGKKQEKRYF